MRLDTLTVELRPRSSWEAMELGTALVRRHAAAIWVPWLIVTGTVFALLNLAAWAIGHVWLAWLLMWWLRPVFDRIPMYVLSRAVFGTVPRVADTLRAQLRWGWKPMLGHLTWRRFSPMRAAMLPVDLLEGADPSRLAERRRVIGGGVAGPAVLLTVACLHFLLALQMSLVLLVVMFIPNELLAEVAREVWAALETDPPTWALIALNAVDWLAVAFIEPFFVGAGFGLYLNRRTQLEAWDLEIAFRRMRRRLEALGASTFAVALLAMALLLPASIPAQACDGVDCPSASNALQQTNAGNDASKSAKGGADTADTAGTDQEAADARAAARAAAEAAGKNEEVAPEGQNVQTRTLKEIFGEDVAAHGDFEKAVTEAYKDPLLRPQQKTTTWERRDRKDKKEPEQDEDDIDLSALKWLSGVVGFIVENVLWLLLGALVLALALTAKRWWPWLAGIAAEPEPEPEPVEMMHLAHAEPLPPDIATVARRLWAEGQPRRALALLYRASVEAMTARLDAHPPPGATEADYLRLSRRLPDTEDRDAFRGMVRIWQYAAYGQRLPGADEFETLVQTLAQRFRWAA
jgi:hypothetical protein